MKYVNQGKSRRFVGGGVDTTNCALCTTAGALNLILGRNVWNTELVAVALGKQDTREALGQQTSEQATGIAQFVVQKSNRRVESRGGTTDIPYSTAYSWMSSLRSGTVFAVSVHGYVEQKTNDKPVSKVGHWLNAVKKGDSIVYYDFQADRAHRGYGQSGVVVSPSPIVGIVPQEKSGETGLLRLDGLECTVVAFIPPHFDKQFSDVTFEFQETEQAPKKSGKCDVM